MKVVEVAVGVVIRDTGVFLTRRHDHQHQGGKWEFPGGKKEQGETTTEALRRELAEEIGIDVQASEPLMLIEHDYGDKQVRLDIHVVQAFNGEPSGLEGQESCWASVNTLQDFDFPDANGPIVEALQQRFSL